MILEKHRSHLRKKKNKTKARTPHIPLPDAVTSEIILRTKSMIKYTKRNIAIASSVATFAQNQ